jgi:hypothetical protein
MPCSPKGAAIMTRIITILTLAAAAALAGCNENHNIVAGGEPDDDNNAAANAGVQLPPSIVSSKIYRCGDNKLVYVDWMSDGSAHVKKSKDEVGEAVAANSPQLKGNAEAASISLNGQTCKA